jgi:hypothetical protein
LVFTAETADDAERGNFIALFLAALSAVSAVNTTVFAQV